MTPTLAKHSAKPRTMKSAIIGPLLLALLVALSFGSWAFSSAVGSGPDDDYHLGSIWCSSISGPVCDEAPDDGGVLVPAALQEAVDCISQKAQQSAGCQPFLDGTDARPDVASGENNQTRNLYPDGYYQVASLLKSDSIQATALAVRFMNIGLFLFAGLGLFFALPLRLRATWVWMWSLAVVPLAIFVIASSNPSAWAIIAVASGWISLLGYLESSGPRAWVLGLAYALSAVLAISSRIDSVLYLAFATVIAVWLSDSRGKKLLVKIWPGFIGLALVILQLIINPANLARVVRGIGQRSEEYEDPLPWVTSPEVADGSAFDWSLFWHNLLAIPGLWLGVFGGYPWGSLGWLDTNVPQVVSLSTIIVLAGLVFLASASADYKKLAGMLATVVALWAIPLYLLQLGGFQAGEQVQPRYLVPLMMVFLGTMLLTSSGKPLLSDPRALWFVIVALSVANAIALHTNIRRYTTGIRVQGFNLDSPREWWWPFFPDFLSPNVVWAIGTMAFGVLLWALLMRVVPSITRALELRETKDSASASAP